MAIPHNPLKWFFLAALGAAISVLWLECVSCYLVLRVRREYAALERLLTEYDRFDAALSTRLQARIRDLQDGGAPRRDIADARVELNLFRREYTEVFAKFRRRSRDLWRLIDD